MIWIIFALVGGLFFGMIAWLKPSPREQHLSRLRADALVKKLNVKYTSFEANSAKTGVRDNIKGTSYSLISGNKKGTLKYRIVKQAAWDTDYLPEGYAWHDKGTEEEAEIFKKALTQLQDELLMLEVYTNRVTIIPAENKEASAENYQGFLNVFLSE